MSTYRIRFVAPTQSDFVEVAGHDVPDAVGNFLEARLGGCLFVQPEKLGPESRETVYFAVVDVEGHGELVGRHFYSGIGRKGGVRVPNPREMGSLAAVEKVLGLADGSLSDADWEGEESEDDARRRRWG